MTGLMSGADVEALEQFARSLRSAGEHLASIESQLSGAIRSTHWTGPDGQRFQTEWPSDSARLRSTVAALTDAAAAVQRNAQEQRAASADGGGAGGARRFIGAGGFSGGGGGGGGGGGWGDSSTWQGSVRVNGLSAAGTLDGSGSAGPVDWSAGMSAEMMTGHLDAGTYSHGLRYDPIHHEWIPAEIGVTAAAAYNVAAVAAHAGARLGAAELGAQGSAKVGGEVKADAHAYAGPDGVGGQASVGGYLGAKAEGSLTGSIAGQQATASGHVTAGVEFHAQAEATISLDKVEVGVSVGAALGIGGGLDFKIELDPAAAAEHLADAITHPSFPHLW